VNLLFFMSVLSLKTDSTNLQLVRPMGSRSQDLAQYLDDRQQAARKELAQLIPQ